MRLEVDLLVGSFASPALGSVLEDWPPVQQCRFRIVRASFEFLDGMLRAAHQLYTTNVPPDMRIVRVFGVEPAYIDPQKSQAAGILTILVASAGFEALADPEVGEPPPEIPEMVVKIMTYYDPRLLPAREDT